MIRPSEMKKISLKELCTGTDTYGYIESTNGNVFEVRQDKENQNVYLCYMDSSNYAVIVNVFNMNNYIAVAYNGNAVAGAVQLGKDIVKNIEDYSIYRRKFYK